MNLLQSLPGIGNNTGFLHKIIYIQRREKFGGAIGRKHVIGTGKIIAQRFAGIFSQENSSRIAYLCHNGIRILRKDFQMLGSDFVRRIYGAVKTVGNQYVSIIIKRFPDGITAA